MRILRNPVWALLGLAGIVAIVVGAVALDDPAQWIVALAGGIVLAVVGFHLIGWSDEDRAHEAPVPPGGHGGGL